MLSNIEYQKNKVENNFNELIEIMQLYTKLKNITEFVLDLQIYNDNDYKTEPRIWLTANKSNLGINLMLYSINLDDIKNENACEVFSEYMQYYAMNENKFEVTTSYDFKTNLKINFEISNR